MAAHKFLKNNAGVITEEAAVNSSAGAGDEGKIPALNAGGFLGSTIVNSVTSSAGAGSSGKLPALDGTGRLDDTFMPVGIAADVANITASEALSAGDFVNIHNDTGAKIRKADATVAGKEAHGFVLESVEDEAVGTVYFEGSNTQVSGHIPGPVFLSTTAGQATSTAPGAAGNVGQRIGFVVSATVINFQAQTPIVLA